MKWFGKNKEEAKKVYHQYMQSGISRERRPELVGGNLIRSLGKWSDVASLRQKPEEKKEGRDRRILGSSDFVEKVLKEADEKIKHQIPAHKLRAKIQERIERICKTEGVLLAELRSGSRRGKLSRIRLEIAMELIKEYGVSLAELGRQLGVTTGAVSRMLSRHGFDMSRYIGCPQDPASRDGHIGSSWAVP